MLKGITITYFDKVQKGEDDFGGPIYEPIEIEVEDVLVAPVSTQDVIDNLSLYGVKAVYQLAIPKGNQLDWENRIVEFFGNKWKTVGIPQEGIEDLIPLRWNKKVLVERYE